jgi:hypothetical protein
MSLFATGENRAGAKTEQVVPRASAVVPGQADAEPIVIHANHVDMVRYASRDDIGFVTISEHLQIMAKDAAEAVRRCWEAERRMGEGRQRHQTEPL